MAQISFYHLTKTNLEDALPKLLEKILETEKKAVVLCKNDEVKNIDELLWSVGGRRFIPHGTESSEDIELQPVYISAKEENPNDSSFLVLRNFSETNFYSKFDRTLIIFNANSESELSYARNLWKELKSENEYELKYFLQNDKGAWQEKEN